MRLAFSRHAERQMVKRNVTRAEVQLVVSRPQHVLRNLVKGTYVAIGQVSGRWIVAVFIKRGDLIRVVTAYPTRDAERLIARKVRRGVWRRLR